MKAIFTCKLYLASSRKDRILAAIQNPINSELVTQLRKYLDDESVEDIHMDESDSGDDEPISNEPTVDEDIEISEDFDSNDEVNPPSQSSYSDDDILDALNQDSKSAGARRVDTQDSELWVYYSDNMNLDTVMESVISQVNELIPTASFNRLARTSNAIVFTIDK